MTQTPPEPRAWTPLEAALTMVIIQHGTAIAEREPRLDGDVMVWPDCSDINAKTLVDIQDLCAGRLTPEAYFERWDQPPEP